MKNFIQVFDKLSKRFGNSVTAYSKIDLLASWGESREFTLSWKTRLLEVEITYQVFETNDNLTIRYFLENSCD